MIITDKKSLLKVVFVLLFFLWLIITFHIFYVYIYEVSPKYPVKGGTLVEAGVGLPFYLPYSSDIDKYKFYQALLFRSCLSPYVSGTQILYREDLCEVKTDNFRDFYVYLKGNNFWSDGVPINLNDVFFTYNDILIHNKFQFPNLEKYKNIKIEKKNEFIKISFPYPSKDNLIFFSNFILPKHVLYDKNKDYYLNKFPFELVNSNCASLKLFESDRHSILFDFKKCKDFYINNFQYKFFENEEQMKQYIDSQKKKIIDFYFIDKQISGYNLYPYILNNYLVIFFNSKSTNIDLNFKRLFISFLNNDVLSGNFYRYFVKVNDFFKFEVPGYSFDNFLAYFKFRTNEALDNKIVERKLPKLPKEIVFSGEKNVYYFEKNITDRYTLNFYLPNGCDNVGVIYNSGHIYWLKKYKRGSKIAYYNISPKFFNIKKGKNVYNVVCKDRDEKVYTLILRWKELPKVKIKKKRKNNKIRIVYYKDKAIVDLISFLKSRLKEKNLLKYFDIRAVESSNELKGILIGGSYDIVVIGLYLGLKRDIGDLFISEDPLVNPSKYKNLELKSLYSQYLISIGKTRQILKKQIDKIYNQTIPLYFIGKYIDRYGQREEFKTPLFPKRLYNLWLRKEYIKDNKLVYKPVVKKEIVFNWKNFKKWIEKNFAK